MLEPDRRGMFYSLIKSVVGRLCGLHRAGVVVLRCSKATNLQINL